MKAFATVSADGEEVSWSGVRCIWRKVSKGKRQSRSGEEQQMNRSKVGFHARFQSLSPPTTTTFRSNSLTYQNLGWQLHTFPAAAAVSYPEGFPYLPTQLLSSIPEPKPWFHSKDQVKLPFLYPCSHLPKVSRECGRQRLKIPVDECKWKDHLHLLSSNWLNLKRTRQADDLLVKRKVYLIDWK